MSAMKIKSRSIGAKTAIERLGQPIVSSFTGGTVDLVTSATSEGFNPLDLLFASLSSCLALSFRIAVSESGLIERFRSAHVEVTGKKSDGDVKHIESFAALIRVDGDFSPEELEMLLHRAEDICTVSNTLKRSHSIDLKLKP